MLLLSDNQFETDLINWLPQAVLAPIPHGDFNILGFWHDQEAIRIAGDRKHLGDMLKCIDDGRHVQQVQDCWAAGFKFVFVVLEAIFRPDPVSGLLQEFHNGWRDYDLNHGNSKHPRYIEYNRLAMYLLEARYHMGVQIIQTASSWETARQIQALDTLFSVPPERHASLNKFFEPPNAMPQFAGRPPLVQRMAKELTGFGWNRAAAVAKVFPTPSDMVQAGSTSWEAIPGIGKKLADSAFMEINNA